MKTTYRINEFDHMIQVMLMSTDLGKDYNITVSQAISFNDINKCGNLIDKQVFAGKFLYLMLKEYQMILNQKIVSVSMIIENEDLKEKLIEYGKDILSSKIEVISVEMFKEIVDKINEIIKKKERI